MADISEDVIIVTSSLTKDMTGKDDLFRGPAIRALCKITDASMLHAIERYMKQVRHAVDMKVEWINSTDREDKEDDSFKRKSSHTCVLERVKAVFDDVAELLSLVRFPIRRSWTE